MHPLLILVLVFDLLIAVSSVLNLVNMMRVNLMVEERRAEALTVQRVRVQKAAAGKGGILASWYGVYACPAKDGTGEFTSSNPYGSEAAVPASTTVVPSRPPVCWSSATSPPTCAAALSRCGSRRPHSRLCWRLSSASEQALFPFSSFRHTAFPLRPSDPQAAGARYDAGKI